MEDKVRASLWLSGEESLANGETLGSLLIQDPICCGATGLCAPASAHALRALELQLLKPVRPGVSALQQESHHNEKPGATPREKSTQH